MTAPIPIDPSRPPQLLAIHAWDGFRVLSRSKDLVLHASPQGPRSADHESPVLLIKQSGLTGPCPTINTSRPVSRTGQFKNCRQGSPRRGTISHLVQLPRLSPLTGRVSGPPPPPPRHSNPATDVFPAQRTKSNRRSLETRQPALLLLFPQTILLY